MEASHLVISDEHMIFQLLGKQLLGFAAPRHLFVVTESRLLIDYLEAVRRAEVKDLWKKGYGFKGLFTKPDLYVKVSNDNLFQRSDIVKNSTSPTWNETFPILCSEHEQKIVIEIRHDSTLDTCVGYTEILFGESKYTGGGEVRVDLRCSKDTKAKRVGSVYITLKISDARAIATLSLEKLNKIVLRVNDITDPANVILQGDLVGTIADAAPTINALVKIVDSLADAHPYLKLAWNITSLSYKVVNGQIDFDKQVKDLVAVLTGIFVIIGDTVKIRQPLESFTRATNELLDMTIRCSLLVLEYSRHEFIGRLLHVDTKEEIREYKEKLELLRGNLDSAFARQAVVIASRRADEKLLKRLEYHLKPLYISGRIDLNVWMEHVLIY
ncbi:WD40 domain containing protein [Pyrrhoderma noxium]|uniref:WD40 domain containing protein n=1 Tax=Pyrrhoderma noxium TaxID=2282107 RepID=A0A286U616_9AGAM|nr:WD40 domain containing protein [Pyrrhoderma noxium]